MVASGEMKVGRLVDVKIIRRTLVGTDNWPPEGRFTRYNFVACDMLTTSLRHELFRVNQTYNLLAIVAYDTKNVVGLLKQVSKPYDNRSDRQFYIVEIVYDFLMTLAAGAIKIACDYRKQKSYRVNRGST